MRYDSEQETFREAWQTVLAEAADIGRQRGDEYGEMFAAPELLLVDRETALDAMISIKAHRLATAQSDCVVEDTLLDLIVYAAMRVVVGRRGNGEKTC